MNSPYTVCKQVNRVHVVRTILGFERILEIVARCMERDLSAILADRHSPEWGVFNDLYSAYETAMTSQSRVVVFLGSNHDFLSSEKFERVVVLDFSGKKTS